MKNNFNILVGVELDTSNIQKQLSEKKYKLDTKEAKQNVDDLAKSMEDAELSFQAANEIFSKTIDVITSMAEQVYELDSALIEFQKVSDLSGSALDSYVDKLSAMGSSVARTGKPRCQAPDIGIVNQY